MRTITKIVAVLSLSLSASAFADTNCREEANSVGYVGAADVLSQCEPAKTAVNEEMQVNERIVEKADRKEEARAIAQAKRKNAPQPQ